MGGLTPQEVKTPYDRLGGDGGVRALVTRFYQLMDAEPNFAALRALHGADLSKPRQALYEFLSGWLGGPPLYFEKPGHRCIMSTHARIKIGPEAVRQWLSCMQQALGEFHLEHELRQKILAMLANLAGRMRNQP